MLELLEDHERIPYICRLLYEAYRLPVAWMNTKGETEQTPPHPSAHTRPPVEGVQGLPAEVLEMMQEAAGSRKDPRTTAFPLICTTAYLENFIILPLYGELEPAGAIVIGPSLYAPLTEDNAGILLRDHNIPAGGQEAWLQYYRSLPVLDRMRLYHAAILLYFAAAY
ncbi:hypothetical protein [Paenibacillus sonchi]|uniref:hypothetical protein n=1 Tax=Paenibacillus sonchi TaxID=373687 RepID=UPI001E2C3420|nr:hypothetical protein [Paenibacillus sonchi]MCE3199635.1 hypothetical protein [Paenibacillus sonchi]